MAVRDTELCRVYIAEVEPHFSSGVEWLIYMIDLLKHIPNNPNRMQVEAQVRPISEAARVSCQQFQFADEVSTEHRQDVDQRIEMLIQRQSESGEKHRESQLNLERQKVLHSQTVKECQRIEQELEKAAKRVVELGGKVDRVDDHVDTAVKGVTTFGVVGLGVTAVAAVLSGPVGWVAGITTLGGMSFGTGIGLAAKQRLDEAKKDLQLARSNKATKQEKQRVAAGSVERSRVELETLQKTIDEIKQQLALLRKEQRRVTDCSEWIKNCSTYLELALGKAEVMEGTTKSVYTFEPLINVLGNLVTHLDQGPGRQLAESCMQRLSLEKSDLEQKIKAVDAVSHRHIYDDFA